MKLSKSSVNEFLKCRRAFKYQYIDEIQQAPNEYMQLGLDVHEIAEKFVKEGGINSEDYRSKLDELAIEVGSEFDLKIHLDHLAEFFEEVFHNPDMKYEVFSCEEYLHDLEHDFSGLCDLVVRDENNDIIIIDYKTGRSGSIKKYRLELMYYRMMIENKYPNVEVISAGIFFTKDGKFRFINFVEVQEKGAFCTEEDYNASLELLDFIRGEVKAQRFYPNKQYICKYCGYKSMCEADGGF